jgi:glycosyltransferase involved in cell wall biosynthesis
MSWGLPVVVTDVAGHRDVVRSSDNGIVVPFDHAEALGQGIITLLNDRDLRIAFGGRGRLDVSQRYSSTAMARAYEELYKRTIAASRSVRSTSISDTLS